MLYQVDISKLLLKKAGEHLLTAYNFSSSSENSDLKKEAEACIQAIVLFQSAMEGIITEEIENEPRLLQVKNVNQELSTKHKSLSFKNKWERSFDVLRIKDRQELDAYFEFYSRYRIPILHPVSRYISLEGYTFKKVTTGLKNGWNAMQLLENALNKVKMTWEQFLEEEGLSTS
jgi:hypothetical protein